MNEENQIEELREEVKILVEENEHLKRLSEVQGIEIKVLHQKLETRNALGVFQDAEGQSSPDGMDKNSIFIQYTPKEISPMLDRACEKNDATLVRLLSDLASFNRPAFVSLEAATAFIALATKE